MHRRYHILKALPLCALFSLALAPAAEAARVEKVKGKQVLIDGEGEDLQEGQKVFIMIDGKKKGLVLISKVKNGKAIGNLTKGKAQVDAGIEVAGKGGTADSGGGKKRRKRGGGEGGEPGLFVGAILGMGMDSQTVKDQNGASVAMSGYGFSLKGYGDMPISGRLGLIGRVGFEQLSVKSAASDTVPAHQTSILYATADLLLRYSFSDSGFIPWFGGGLSLLFPLSKSSDVLDVPRIAATTVGLVDLGFNYMMSDKMMIIGVVEAGVFPPSNDVSTLILGGKLGAAWRW